MEPIPSTPFRLHGEVEYRVKGRILHTIATGPFDKLVSAIPATINEFINRLSQQGTWGQIVVFRQSARMSPEVEEEFAAHLKTRYAAAETRPVVALVFEGDIEDSAEMAPRFLHCYAQAQLQARLFDDYATALDWIETSISQFSTRIQWDSSYEIGDPAIDEQHRELFKRAAYVIGATSHEGQVIAAMRLFQYMRTHLSHEEELMRRLAYPDIAEHTREHKELIASLNQISLKIAKENLSKSELETFIADWFLSHMASSDQALADFAKVHQPAAP